MRFKVKHISGFNSKSRVELAKMLSLVIDARKNEGIPLKPNEGDDTFWSLDSGNNWRLCFRPEPGVFDVWHRYNADSALFAWLVERFDFEVVPQQ